MQPNMHKVELAIFRMSDSEQPTPPTSSSSSSVSTEKEKPSDSFKAKHKAVFAFDEVKIKSVGTGLDQDSEKSSKEDVSKFRGKESMFREDDRDDRGFKKPSRPGTRPYEPPRNRKVPYEDRGPRGRDGRRGSGGRGGRSVPDFRANPDKYTKYNLADVDLPTNTSNSQAAFAFLDEVKKRKAGESVDEEVGVQEGAKFTFKKPTKKHCGRENNADEAEEVAADEGGSKVVLPASEGGAKKKSKDSLKEGSEVKEKKGKKSNQMTLSHLMDEEDDDDDDDDEDE